MSDPKNEESPEQTSTTPSVETPGESTENEPAVEPATAEKAAPEEAVAEEADEPAEQVTEPTTEAASADVDASSDKAEQADEPKQATDESITTDETVALPVVEPETTESRPATEPEPTPTPEPEATSAADAPTVQIPVRSHVPKAPPQRISPRGEEPPVQPEPARVAVQPTPTRIPPARDRSRGRWLIAAGAAAVLVVVAIVAAGVIVFLKDRADNSPESRIRSSIDTFVGALESGDLTTLRESTCGALSDFYETVDPENFRDIHRLAVEQGEIPVVTSVDRIQITEGTAIAQVTAHTVNDPGDVTDRTFDLTLDGEQWKVCSE
ncbi:Rv0361 family membrane protein [Rhodococcus rhodochrous]|uniref:Rv0361 family membrane protein n=1 Tax=Rhodococcus rhodochrous TaxID=1829 RepID=UPI001E2D7739|nr:hypothetical protein [Rhodococcus rhodochrous]MCD2099188.1 hypothetical protein [Rhodococcus rhodochrous]MCD2120633.1 hypothetical protein [Rhodococcus rhodochrous]MCQ4136079.1 hypothetical protein [Rhodococcus rhodochrous]MDJ0017499.1 hypothetical protein [Rhodococcus rhodochrous]